jgi:hypothetical protein
VACCVGPILAVLGAIAALGVISTIFIGAVGLLPVAAAIVAVIVVRRHRREACATLAEQVLVELIRR